MSSIWGSLYTTLPNNNFPEPLNLIATAGNQSVSLIWDVPQLSDKPIRYNIKMHSSDQIINNQHKLSSNKNPSKSGDNRSGEDAILDYYNIYRADIQGGTYLVIGTSTSENYNDNTVINGTTYYYVVTAVYINPNGESIYSNEASATPANQEPLVTISYPTDGQTFTNPNIIVRGTSSDPARSVTQVEVKLNNGDWNLASGTANWSYSLILEDGSNTICARAKDNQGIYSQEVPVGVTYFALPEYWSNLNPVPNGNLLKSVFFINNSIGWMSGSGGLILKTTNTGDDWIQQVTNTGSTIKSIYFVDELVGWAVGANGTILFTSDGGNDWILQASNVTTELNSVKFVNPNIGWAVGYSGTILKTTNGGTTWVAQSSGTTTTLFDIDFYDTNFLIAVGGYTDLIIERSTILKTTNGGTTWVDKNYSSSVYGLLYGVEILENNLVWTCGQAFMLAKSTDAGETWGITLNGSKNNIDNSESVDGMGGFRDIFFKDNNIGYAVGGELQTNGYPKNRKIIMTSDGGNSWVYKLSEQYERELFSVNVTEDYNGLAVGSNGVILRSTDDGNTWKQQLSGSGVAAAVNINSICFISEDVGFAVGERNNYSGDLPGGAILKTTNGGNVWLITNFIGYSGDYLVDIFFIDETTGWTIFNKISPFPTSSILKTTDGGNTWNSSNIASSNQTSIFFSDQNNGWITTSSGIWSTTNEGTGWIKKNNSSCSSTYFFDSTLGFITSGSGVYKTTDGGTNWTQKSNVSSSSIYFIDDITGWFAGGSGAIYKTTDGGETWTNKNSGISQSLNEIHFSDLNNGIAVGANGTLLKTTDGGESWELLNTGTSKYFYTTQFYNNSTAWAAGRDGLVLKYFNPTTNQAPILTWVNETGYESDGVDPDSGNTSSTFTFKVKYTDADGDPPQTDFPKLHLLKDGSGIIGSPFTMQEDPTKLKIKQTRGKDRKNNLSLNNNGVFLSENTIGDGFTEGVIYECQINEVDSGSDYTYYFEANDINGDSASGEATVEQSGPVINSTNLTNDYLLISRNPLGGNDADIYQIKADGTDLSVIYDDAGRCQAVDVSFDGSKIIFSSDASTTGRQEVYIMNSGSNNAQQITSNGDYYSSTYPRFYGPDKIWYDRGPSAGVHEWWEMNYDGTGQLQITNWGAQGKQSDFFSFNYDQTKVVYAKGNPSSASSHDIYIANNDLSGEVGLTNNSIFDDMPKYSPDGTKIVWAQDNNIWIMNSDGTNSQQLTNVSSGQNCFWPTFSRDGSKIYYSYYDGLQRDIYEMNIDGTNKINHTSTPNFDEVAYCIIDVIQNTFALTVSVTNGWNMVSVPGSNSGGMDVSSWWPNHTGTVWGFDGIQYITTSTATPGEGYWMKNTLAETYSYPTIEIVAHDPINVTAGWNMIGGYETSPSITSLKAANPQITGTVWGFDGVQYVAATNLVPGYAYWTKVTSAGNIIIPEALAKGNEVTEMFKEEWGRIIMTDAAGSSYILYAVKGDSSNSGAGVDLNQYELPPLPPAGNFDIRFGSGRIAEEITSEFKTISLSGITYPVKVKVVNMDIRLQDVTGKEINTNVKSGEEVTISNQNIDKLMVSGQLIPEKYALEQNFPNPFNPTTTIRFSIPKEVQVNLSVYNILGEKVKELKNEVMKPGYFEVNFDASAMASGVYIYRIKAGDFVQTKKMILLK